MDDIATTPPGPAQNTVQWRYFLRAMAEEVDSLAGEGDRDDMLRGVGRRMSRLMPLPAVQTLLALEIEMNDALSGAGWGEAQLRLDEAERSLHIVHKNFPRIGSMGHPAGQWLSALLEGLYDGWFSQQPGNQASLSTRRVEGAEEGTTVVLTYARR